MRLAHVSDHSIVPNQASDEVRQQSQDEFKQLAHGDSC